MKIDPAQVGWIDGDVAKTIALLKHVHVDTALIASGATAIHSAAKALRAEANSGIEGSGWHELLPRTMQGDASSDDDKSNYFGMMIAIDHRHWVSPDFAVESVTTPEQLAFQPVRCQQMWYASPRDGWCRGSMAMMTALRDAVDEHGVHWYRPDVILSPDYSPDFLGGLMVFAVQPLDAPAPTSERTFEQVREAWGGRTTSLPAMPERVVILKQVAASLVAVAGPGHSFHALAAQAKGRLFNDGTGFIERVAELSPRYVDNATVQPGGHLVHLIKLATLTAVALTRARAAFADATPLHFTDLSSAAVCPDYQIPKALRAAGVLRYSPHLADLVDRHCLLPSGSEEEVELRLASTVAGRALLETMPGEDALSLDFVLWWVGRSSSSAAHHLTIGMFY